MKIELLAGVLLGGTILFNLNPASANTIEEIVSDMSPVGDAFPHGAPTSWDWARGAVIQTKYCPAGWSSVTGWGLINRDSSDSPDTNTRVQIKNIKTYLKSRSTGRWQLLQSTVNVAGAAFEEYISTNRAIPPDIRSLSDGSVAVKLTHGYNYHFWPSTTRPSINGGDVAGVFVTYQARLIVDDVNRWDDRGVAKYLGQAGADWWQNFVAVWNNFKTNKGVSISRFKYVTPAWQSFSTSTLTETELRANPPPLD